MECHHALTEMPPFVAAMEEDDVDDDDDDDYVDVDDDVDDDDDDDNDALATPYPLVLTLSLQCFIARQKVLIPEWNEFPRPKNF